ncbi:cell division protein ZapB [Marinospirillum sp. MEB164]|uniref:Cell division protein ZapB n=1 Tax=Marinospirillum alkalitolerans TaxID=3123374 RepID=A0ABW8PV76_9GAMM
MSLDLLSQLEAKVQTTLDNLDMLRLEMDELKEENAQLKAEKQAWEEKLGLLLGKFSELESTMDEAKDEAEAPAEESTSSSW